LYVVVMDVPSGPGTVTEGIVFSVCASQTAPEIRPPDLTNYGQPRVFCNRFLSRRRFSESVRKSVVGVQPIVSHSVV
jgi:hypothetical protein